MVHLMVFDFFDRSGRTSRKAVVTSLHDALNAAARRPVLFDPLGLADTVEGRFESVTLHTIVLVRRLNALPAPGPEIAVDLLDAVFTNFELALRVIGIGDVSVPKRMKKFATSFYGRVGAYEEALAAGDRGALSTALLKNAYAGEVPPETADRLTEEAFALDRQLDVLAIDEVVAGRLPWPRETDGEVPHEQA